MPDDERPGGTHSSANGASGYGRRHRRAAEDPPEKPRRRRRSMEDGQGGVSVADLVQRHGTSRHDLSPIPDPPGHRTGQSHARPAESQPRPGRRPAEAAPQWPDQERHSDPYQEPPGHPTRGRRAMPEPQGYAPADPPATGRRAMPQPPADVPPTPSTSRRIADALTPDSLVPDEHTRRVPPGQSTGNYPVPPGHGTGNYPVPPGQNTGNYPVPRPGGRGLPPGHATGRRVMPEEGFGPYRGAPDEGYGAPEGGFGPGVAGSGRRPAPAPAPAPDNGFPQPGRRGPDNGFGPAGPAGPANGFGPGVDNGYDNGYDPGYDPGYDNDAGYDEGIDYGIDYGNDYGGDTGFGPDSRGHGRGNNRPDNGFGPAGPAGPVDFGPGQGTGQRRMPPGGFGPGQNSAPRPGLPPGHGSGPNPMPGQNTGGRPLPPMPGQNTGNYPVPPHVHQSGAIPRDAIPPGPGGPNVQHSGAIPRDPNLAGPKGPSGPSGPKPPNPPNPNAQGEDRPALPGARDGDERTREGAKKVPLPPPRNPEDAISMTTEMEAIGEEVQKRRGIDHTLARFSAVHDEIQAEERQRKAKRRKLMPWRKAEVDEMDQLDELVAQQTLNAPRPKPGTPKRGGPKPGPEQGSKPGAEPGQEPELNELLIDEDGAVRPMERKPRLDRSTMALRVAAATAAILVFIATGIAWGFKSWVDASSQQVDALDPNSKDIQDAAKQRGDENFLLVGSDTRAGAEAEDGVGDEKEVVGARSDTVMVAHVPANRERAVVVSFPRDLEVRRPACEGWDPKTGDYTGEQKPAAEQVKLNTAYQVGGPKCVTKLVQQLSGLMINHFVGIDFHGFKGMVDAVHGVDVCVDEPLKDDVLGTIVPQAGKNVTISGDQALNFVRARHVQGDLTSDYGRIKRQQRFLSSLLRKAMSSEVLLDPGKLTNFVDAFSKSTFGDNIGVDQMITLGQSLQGVAAGKVTFITVPTVGEANDNGNEDLRVDDTKSLFRAIREDTPLPGEKGGTQQLTKTAPLALQKQGPVDPKTIKLQVLNGGNPTGGIAGTTADQLAGFGYQIVWVDAAPDKVKKTVIKYAKGREAQAQTLQSSVPGAELEEDPSLAGAIQLIIGPGFDGKVVAPGKGKPAPDLPDDLSTVNGGDSSCA